MTKDDFDGGFDWASMCDEPVDEENEKNAKRCMELIEKWSEENKPPTLYQIIHDEIEDIMNITLTEEKKEELDLMREQIL